MNLNKLQLNEEERNHFFVTKVNFLWLFYFFVTCFEHKVFFIVI